MGDPYYWYWATYSTTSAPAPSFGELLIVLLIPLLVVALCVGLVLWHCTDRPRHGRGLTRRERRVLAVIEGSLCAEDPDLQRRLTEFAARAAALPSPPRRTETTT